MPSLLVTLRSLSAYSFQGVNYLPQLIWGILRDNILVARLLRGYDWEKDISQPDLVNEGVCK